MTYVHVLLVLNIATLVLVAHLWWVTQKWRWSDDERTRLRALELKRKVEEATGADLSEIHKGIP